MEGLGRMALARSASHPSEQWLTGDQFLDKGMYIVEMGINYYSDGNKYIDLYYNYLLTYIKEYWDHFEELYEIKDENEVGKIIAGIISYSDIESKADAEQKINYMMDRWREYSTDQRIYLNIKREYERVLNDAEAAYEILTKENTLQNKGNLVYVFLEGMVWINTLFSGSGLSGYGSQNLAINWENSDSYRLILIFNNGEKIGYNSYMYAAMNGCILIGVGSYFSELRNSMSSMEALEDQIIATPNLLGNNRSVNYIIVYINLMKDRSLPQKEKEIVLFCLFYNLYRSYNSFGEMMNGEILLEPEVCPREYGLEISGELRSKIINLYNTGRYHFEQYRFGDFGKSFSDFAKGITKEFILSDYEECDSEELTKVIMANIYGIHITRKIFHARDRSIRYKLPVRNPVSPVRNPVSPVRNPVSPVRNPVSPVRNPVSPVRNPVSPVRRPASPIRTIDWPEGLTINGQKEGPWFIYDENGLLEESGNYVNGVKTGAWSVYNEDGTLNSSGLYRNNIREGPWVLFHQGGKGIVNAEGIFTNDRQSGRWTVYHPDGRFKKYVDY